MVDDRSKLEEASSTIEHRSQSWLEVCKWSKRLLWALQLLTIKITGKSEIQIISAFSYPFHHLNILTLNLIILILILIYMMEQIALKLKLS